MSINTSNATEMLSTQQAANLLNVMNKPCTFVCLCGPLKKHALSTSGSICFFPR